ncbi:MAG: FAD-dependent oxidoreductase [Acidocella sp.]|nr:FAD-dependent oxidoreductase [Acidocella sp.]
MGITKTAAIVGAGMAGLTVAAHLAKMGWGVTLFDKGRKPGGRMATRLQDGFIFNHGCQFASAHDAGFRAALIANQAKIWPATGNKFSGTPSMASLAASFASGLNVQLNTHVSFMAKQDAGWRLSLHDASTTPPGLVDPQGELSAAFDALILAIPAPQATALLAAINHPFAGELAKVHLAPCWALMLGFAGATPGPDIVKPPTGPLSWIARENTRPGAGPQPVSYTAHASAAWSAAHLERPADDIIATLSTAFAQATGISAPATLARAHRWRYALADAPLSQDHLWDPHQQLGLCGDWCLAGKLEAAYLSGRSLGIRLTT